MKEEIQIQQTKIKDVKCTISDVTTQFIYYKIEPTPEPVNMISISNSKNNRKMKKK
jgi:methyltransferase-like protein